jgi:bacillolysin
VRSNRASSCVVTAALLLGLCAATSTTSATAVAEQPGSGVDRSAAAERLLRADAVDPVVVATGADGSAEFVGTLGAPVDAPAVPAGAGPVQAATEHLERYGALFDVTAPRTQLDVTEVVDAAGSHIVKYGQQVDGLPVLGGELAVSVDADGALQAVNGETTDPGVQVPAPAEHADAAVHTAVRTTADIHGVPAATLTAGPAERWFYDPGLLGSPHPFRPGPVWRVEVSNDSDIRQLVLVDTATGRVVETANQIAHAHAVCDRTTQGQVRIDAPCNRADYARADGDPPIGDRNVDLAFESIAETVELYGQIGVDLTRMIGRTGVDGRKIRATVKIAMDNAFWNGREAYFGRGFDVADDVVGHELTHGVVQHTAGLFLLYQAGAMNESMADVFGEIVDQRNGRGTDGATSDWLIGENARIGPIRDMQAPGRFGDPDSMRSTRYVADTRLRDAGGVHDNAGVGNKAAYLIMHGGVLNGQRVVGIEPARTDPAFGLKTARIYLRALRMLTSGSDYADLGHVLPQACRALLASPAIERSDCVQVNNAVKATQLLLQPRVASAPEAPRCATRNAPSRRLFFDNMERPARRVWSFGRLWTRLPRPGLGLLGPYATSGRRSLFGLDSDPSRGQPAKSSLVLRRGIRVPVSGRTFLRFDHARLFEYNFRTGQRARYFDGGRLEYSLNRGRTWTNAAGLRWVNGPRQSVIGPGPRPFRGFGGDSHGYMSSRLDLSRLAGRTVRLRWTVAADPAVGFVSSMEFFGWWIDDVEAYTCRRR